LRLLRPLLRDRGRLRLRAEEVAQIRARTAASNEKLRRRLFWTRPELF